MKLSYFSLFVMTLAVLVLPEFSFAQDEKLSDQLCDLRQMFCGLGGGAIMTVLVITIGLTVFSGKVHWSFIVTMVAASAFFFNAGWIGNLIMFNLFDLNIVVCPCI